MKLNRKGFMLVEVVVVSAVIATVLVTMFIAINRVSSAYRSRDSYNSIDALYLAMAENDILIEENRLDDLYSNGDSVEITDSNLINAYSNVGNIKLYFSLYNKDKVSSLSGNATFNSFIDYICNRFDYTDTRYDYLIISEICKTDDDCYYYALKLKYYD